MAYRKFVVYFCYIVVLLTTAPQIESACSGSYNCVTDTIFQLCVDDAMSPEPNRCIEGTKCHANCLAGNHPCVDAAATCANPPTPTPPTVVEPTECNVAGFMCTGYTADEPKVSRSFVNCIGNSGTPPADALLSPNNCPPNHVCDMNCADECRFSSRPACPASSAAIICTAPGRVANPQVIKNYFLCARITNSGYAVQEYACPGKSVFNPTTLKCAYPEFECLVAGKFPDPKSSVHYYSCFGVPPAMSMTHYKCPAGSRFDSTTKKCIASDVTTIAPTVGQPTTTAPTVGQPTTTAPTGGQPATTAPTGGQPTTTAPTGGQPTTPAPTGGQSTTAATTGSLGPTTAAPSYQCTRPGKFVYPSDCRRYYSCTANGSQFILTVEECPVRTNFSPNSLQCSLLYSC